jgi:DNA-binding NtrC family response regulator|tara:strand:+ start:678 stop:854 length:177 start_codon:yes stop_codon:yes gene_type:complete
MTIREAHIILIIKAMNRCDGHKANAAKKLEITERTLYRYLDVYSIDKVEGKYVEIKDK